MSTEFAYRGVERCRACGESGLEPVLSLGAIPLANAFRSPDDDSEELRYPLELLRCPRCQLVLLSIVVRPDALFGHYLYTSSASTPIVTHFAELAADLVPRLARAGSLVVEIGSNDGVLLRPLRRRGARVLGVEPASNVAAIAMAAGLDTWNEFFGEDVARRIAAQKGRAAVVVANNVLAHVDDLADLLRGIDALLEEDGTFVAEVPYLVDLLEHTEYDTIYHEHLSYFAVAPLCALFERAGLEVWDVRRLRVHGGSIRVYASRAGRRPTTGVADALIAMEGARGLNQRGVYASFADAVALSRRSLLALLAELRDAGARLAGYGATAKGSTLLNYCGIGPETIPYIADTTPLKQGRLTPGTRIPVVAEEAFRRDRPDRTLLLAWNYADSILRSHREYLAAGGRFVHPITASVLEP